MIELMTALLRLHGWDPDIDHASPRPRQEIYAAMRRARAHRRMTITMSLVASGLVVAGEVSKGQPGAELLSVLWLLVLFGSLISTAMVRDGLYSLSPSAVRRYRARLPKAQQARLEEILSGQGFVLESQIQELARRTKGFAACRALEDSAP